MALTIRTISVSGWEPALHGMRNAMASWKKSDTKYSAFNGIEIGENDLRLACNLIKGGTEHRKFLRMINVSFDITAPCYWMCEFDTYRIGVTRNSTSFMHKGTSKPFTIEDFDIDDYSENKECWDNIIKTLNNLRDEYLKTNDYAYFRTIRQILPMSYNYTSTISLNYEVLLTMYRQRKNHRLEEWRGFCKWIETLPYMSEFIEASEGESKNA